MSHFNAPATHNKYAHKNYCEAFMNDDHLRAQHFPPLYVHKSRDTLIDQWTSKVLRRYGNLNMPSAHLGDLTDIHPAFRINNWKFPVQPGSLASIHDNYALIEGCLTLATAMMKPRDWWRALICGPYTKITSAAIPPYPDWIEIQRHDNFVYNIRVGAVLDMIANRVKFSFENLGTDLGVTRCTYFQNGIGLCEIVMNIGFWDQLRGPKPDVAFLLRVQFLFAATIVHEMAHAVWKSGEINRIKCPNVSAREPFMFDERCSELGHSWEVSLFGGSVGSANDNMDCSDGLMVSLWPFINEGVYKGAITNDETREFSTREYNAAYLIPMSYIQAAHTKAFWEGVFYGTINPKIPRVVGQIWNDVR